MKNNLKGFWIFWTLSVIFLVIFITACSCTCGSDHKYTIRQGNWTYYTNEYHKNEDGCLVFNYNDETKPTIVCGSYTIDENEDYVAK